MGGSIYHCPSYDKAYFFMNNTILKNSKASSGGNILFSLLPKNNVFIKIYNTLF